MYSLFFGKTEGCQGVTVPERVVWRSFQALMWMMNFMMLEIWWANHVAQTSKVELS